jgi:precorrin-2 dehydrogenase/sirohydrochlorin ferrochelatase
VKIYPVSLIIQGKKCLVVGGGSVACRKVRSLLDCGARVEAVSLDFEDQLVRWSSEEPLRLTKGEYNSQALEGAFLVVGATSDQGVNERIAADAKRLGILCNIVDQPDLSDFVLPAVGKKGDLTIAVSTSGKSPALARRLRDRIMETIPKSYATLVQILGALRVHPLMSLGGSEDHKRLWEDLLNSPILNWIEAGDAQSIERLFESLMGEKVTLQELGVKLGS